MDDILTPAVLARLRWHAELGESGFDTLPAGAAGENARWRLGAIVRVLDHLDDTHDLARIFRIVGIEPRVGGEGSVRYRDAF